MRAGPRRRPLRGEAGGVAVFGLFALALCALLVGFAIDATNLYRHQTLLRLAADAAAHAGAVTLARGGSPAEAEAAAAAMVEQNLPEARFGRLVADPAADLRALGFDPATGRLVPAAGGAPAAAVLVRLQRSHAVGNLVPTHALRAVGLGGWTTGASGVAALVPSRRCPNAGGLVARGTLSLGGGAQAGAGVCLHGQEGLALPFGAASPAGGPPRASLPDPARCTGPCAEIGVAAMNLMIPPSAAWVERLAAGFLNPAVTLPEETAFFAEAGFGPDLEPLAEVRVPVRGLRQGDVVRLSPFFFGLLRTYPAGLVYEVNCPAVPGRPRESLTLGDFPEAPPLRGLVLVTDCPLRLGAHVRIEGALMILRGTADIRFQPGARIGAAPGACPAGARTRLMATGDLALPAGLAGAGLGVVAGGALRLEAQEARRIHGFAVQAGGDLRTSGPLVLEGCPEAAGDPVLPPLRVLTHVMPDLEGWVAPLDPDPPARPLPGTPVERLALEGNRAGG